MLDVLDLATITEFGNRDRLAFATRTAGTANTVHVIFGFHWQAVVDDVGDGRNVQTPGSHVGSHQNLHAAVTERHQAAVAQALAQRTVQCHGAEAFLHQIVSQTIALNLRAGKNDGLVDGGVAQPVVQQLALVGHVVGPQQRLGNRCMLFVRRVDFDALWLTHHAGSELHDARRKRGAEHHGLLALDRELVDFGQVVGKAEVQHAVGFVNDEELHLVELDLHAALQVQQTAGRGHDEVSVLQLGNLQLVRNAAHNVGNAQATAMAHQINRVSADLLGQFAGRAQNQRAGRGSLEVADVGRVFALWLLQRRFAASNRFGAQTFEFSAFKTLGLFLLFQQGVQHRQQKRSGLAATRLAGNQQVGEFGGFRVGVEGLHGLRNGGQLHGGGLGEAHVGNGLQQFLGQTQFHKAVWLGHNGFQRGCSSNRLVRREVWNHVDFQVRNGFGGFRRKVAACLKRVSHVFSH